MVMQWLKKYFSTKPPVVFKFRLGDLVYHKTNPEHSWVVVRCYVENRTDDNAPYYRVSRLVSYRPYTNVYSVDETFSERELQGSPGNGT